MPHAMTLAPPEASLFAMARPIPLVPVTMATFLSNSFKDNHSLFRGCRFNQLRNIVFPSFHLKHEAKHREESTPPVAIWKRPDLSGFRTAITRARVQSLNSELAYLKPSITPRT